LEILVVDILGNPKPDTRLVIEVFFVTDEGEEVLVHVDTNQKTPREGEDPTLGWSYEGINEPGEYRVRVVAQVVFFFNTTTFKIVQC
jgi:hypothetical protein